HPVGGGGCVERLDVLVLLPQTVHDTGPDTDHVDHRDGLRVLELRLEPEGGRHGVLLTDALHTGDGVTLTDRDRGLVRTEACDVRTVDAPAGDRVERTARVTEVVDPALLRLKDPRERDD